MAARERLEFDVLARDVNTRKTFEGIADAADRTERSFDDLGDGAGHLQRQIDATSDSMRRLGAEFDRTGEKSLLRDIGRERRTLNGLQKLRGEMLGVAAAASHAHRNSEGLIESLGHLPMRLTGGLIVSLTALTAAAAPAIGAIVGGAVLAGIGSAGIGTGIALAFQDPRVTDAAAGLGTRVKKSFTEAASGFVGPTIQALDILGDAAEGVGRQMEGIFDSLAPEVAPLARALGDLALHAMPGFREAIEAARPALHALERSLPRIGDALSDMFSSIAEEGDGAVLGLIAVLDGLETGIRFTGDTIQWLSDRFERMVFTGAAVSGVLEDIYGWVPLVGDTVKATNNNFEEWRKILEGTKGPSDTAAGGAGRVRDAVAKAGEAATAAKPKFDTLFGQFMSLDEAAIRVEAAFDDVTQSIKDNGRSLDVNSEKGRNNRSALLDAVGAAEQHRQKMIASGQSVAYANAVFQRTVERLYAQARAAGVDVRELDKLLDKYRKLAGQRNIVKTVTTRFVTEGTAPRAARPGQQVAFQHGGRVVGPGSGTSDDIVARLSRGEYVIRAVAARSVGYDLLDRLNVADRRSPVGGFVSPSPLRPVGAGGDVVRDFETALRRVLSGVTLRIDDRTARFADLLTRGG